MIAMYLCRELTENSTNEIGAAFGKNHATILHAEKQVPKLCENNDAVRRAVSTLKRQLQHK
jgi:chromosomal replication initiator protein